MLPYVQMLLIFLTHSTLAGCGTIADCILHMETPLLHIAPLCTALCTDAKVACFMQFELHLIGLISQTECIIARWVFHLVIQRCHAETGWCSAP